MGSMQIHESRLRRLVNDLAVAEILMIQATVESAEIIGTGLTDIAEQFRINPEEREAESSLAKLLRGTAERAVEPYTTRLTYLRQLSDL